MTAGIRLTAGIFALSMIIACQRTGDRATERVVEKLIEAEGREARVEIDRAQGSITVNLGPAVRPPNWPAEVPIDPRASRVRVRSQEGRTWTLGVRSQELPEGLQEYYRRRLVEEGWTLDESVTRSDGILATKGTSRLTATFSARDDGSRARIELERGT